MVHLQRAQLYIHTKLNGTTLAKAAVVHWLVADPERSMTTGRYKVIQ